MVASSVDDLRRDECHDTHSISAKDLLVTTSIGLLLATPATTIGQPQYPDRPIKIIVPFAAGGAVDTMARIVADKLTSEW